MKPLFNRRAKEEDFEIVVRKNYTRIIHEPTGIEVSGATMEKAWNKIKQKLVENEKE